MGSWQFKFVDNYLRDMYVRLYTLSLPVSHSSSVILNKLRRRFQRTRSIGVHLGWQTAHEIVQAEDCQNAEFQEKLFNVSE